MSSIPPLRRSILYILVRETKQHRLNKQGKDTTHVVDIIIYQFSTQKFSFRVLQTYVVNFICQKVQHFLADSEYLGKINIEVNSGH